MLLAQRFLFRIIRRRDKYKPEISSAILSAPVQTFLERLPKAEIHLHFEGTIRAETILALGKKYRIETIRDLRSAAACLEFKDATQFFRKFLYVSSLFREPDDFYLAALDLGEQLTKENILYVEITIAPHKFMRAGVPYPDLIDAIDRGLNDAKGGNLRVHRLIVDIVRDLGPEIGMEMVRAVEEHPHPCVVGIGLGGGENYPPEDSAEVFEYAHSIGLQKTAHAGEGRGPESIWGAIRALGVMRIDHGVRAREDPVLIDYLAQHQIVLNQCPASNVALGVVPSMKEHPIRWYHERDIPVTVGTDDPAFFKVSLTRELANLVAYQDFSVEEIPGLIENAIRASFLDEADKQKWLTRLWDETCELLQPLRSDGAA